MKIFQITEDPKMRHRCNICGKQRPTKEKLKQHQDVVHEGKRFKCTDCDQQHSSNGSLVRHKRAVHEGVKYPCDQCDHKAT